MRSTTWPASSAGCCGSSAWRRWRSRRSSALTATRVIVPLAIPPRSAPAFARRRASASRRGVRRYRRAGRRLIVAAAPSSGEPSCRRPRTATRSATRCGHRWPTSSHRRRHLAGVGGARCSPDRCCSPTGVGSLAVASARSPSLGLAVVGVAAVAQVGAKVVRARPDRRRRARSRRARRDADGAPPRTGRAAPGARRHPGARPHRARARTRHRARHDASRRRRSSPPRRRRRVARAIHFTACLVGPTRPGQLLARRQRAPAAGRLTARSADGDAAAEHDADRRSS